jgi:Calcineurin-like phosphoesterase
MKVRWILAPFFLLVLSVLVTSSSSRALNRKVSIDSFTFAVTADMREFAGPGNYDAPQYFRGAVEAIAAYSSSALMISPGDIDPPWDVYWTITQTLGSSYIWYPVVGNHEIETIEDMAWLRDFDYGAVQLGPSGCPETTYSFDYANTHFAVLNEYCNEAHDDEPDGDVSDHVYNWLAADLGGTTQEHIFVIGHEPAYPQPDADNGRERHIGDSLDKYSTNRDRFWNLLKSEGVTAYICGHTHNYSLVNVRGVWQLDAGHARGEGDPGAPSTFVLVHVNGPIVTYQTYRDDTEGGPYNLMHTGLMDGLHTFLPVAVK